MGQAARRLANDRSERFRCCVRSSRSLHDAIDQDSVCRRSDCGIARIHGEHHFLLSSSVLMVSNEEMRDRALLRTARLSSRLLAVNSPRHLGRDGVDKRQAIPTGPFFGGRRRFRWSEVVCKNPVFDTDKHRSST